MTKLPVVLRIILVISLSGCQQTAYRSYDARPRLQNSSEARLVRYQVSKAFYRLAPDCVVVLPAQGKAKSKDKMLIERAAARHLRGKIAQVIGPDERLRLTRRLALDHTDPADQRYFASHQYKGLLCRYLAIPSIRGIEQNFALFWASRRVHLGLEITSALTGDSLWRGDHLADRSDGGLPLSPFSLGSAAIRASRLNGDKDMLPSMIDDVFRRILKTLPDTRSY